MSKNIQYINKDFSSLKSKLIDFAKIYYPTSYNDFSENSPGMMLIEMAAYVGDILSYYQENQIQENFLQFSKQRKNLLEQSYLYGYRPQVTTVSNVLVDVYQIVPAQNISGTISPDYNYSLIIEEGAQLQSSQNNQIKFIIEDKIDLSVNTPSSPLDISVYSLNISQEPDFYLLKKQVKAYSANIKETQIIFNNPEKFKTITISDDRIIKILEARDSDNNIWYEVPYLAQDTIYDKIENENLPSTPYLLKLKKVPRRFVSRFKSDSKLEIQFGSGISSNADEEIIPNFENIGLGLPYGINKLDVAYDPSNFLYTNTYGLSPSNTTLTFKYLVGGGIESNVNSNTINILSSGDISFKGTVDSMISNNILNSLSFNNESSAIGGSNGDDNEILKQKILASYPTQLRAVTLNDYIIRSLSLPPEYGLVFKVYIVKDNIDGNLLSLYLLSKDINGNFSIADNSLKNNLKTYLNEFKTLTDSINIKDAFVINIGVDFDIVLKPNYNNKEVLKKCISAISDYLHNNKMNINQPIILSDLYSIVDNVEGVQTVKNIEIKNKSNELDGYSKYVYDIKSATNNNIIYPSLDPSIFEVKYPTDIQGRCTSF